MARRSARLWPLDERRRMIIQRTDAHWVCEVSLPATDEHKWRRNYTFDVICATAERAIEMVKTVEPECSIIVCRKVSARLTTGCSLTRQMSHLLAEEAPMETEPGVTITLHGEGVTVEDAIEAAQGTKELLLEVGRTMGVDGVEWEIGSVQFMCDGCDLRRPDRPGPDEGWTHDDGNDYCPACTAERAPSGRDVQG